MRNLKMSINLSGGTRQVNKSGGKQKKKNPIMSDNINYGNYFLILYPKLNFLLAYNTDAN